MIYVSRKTITIPPEERVVGHFGDNKVHTLQFEITDELYENISCELYILFCDGKMNYVTLEKDSESDNIYIWNILSEQIYRSGIAYIQLRAISENEEIWHSPKATVEFLDTIDGEEITGDYSPVIFRKIDDKINEIYQYIINLKYVTYEEVNQLVADTVNELNYITYEAAQQLVEDILKDLDCYITKEEAQTLIDESINELILPLNLRLEGEIYTDT